MVTIAATRTGFPENFYSQEELVEALLEMWRDHVFNPERLRQFHQNVAVGGRHLAVARQRYPQLKTFGQRNDAWLEAALPLAEKLCRELFEESGLPLEQPTLLAFTTVTGLAVPSLEARLMNRLPLRRDLKRMPLFGLGCLAGAAGVARVADYLKGHPRESAILLSIELCSLTLQPQDLSPANLVASGLFGDGGAAVLMVGAEHPLAASGPRVVGSRSAFFPDSERVMGWDISETGFKVVLSPGVPEIASQQVAPATVAYLNEKGLRVEDIDHWVMHPGGPKVMQALETSLGLPEKALEGSRKSLAEVGNVSSASVLFVLDELLRSGRTNTGDRGLLMAMGPAFCAEIVELEW